MPGAELMTFLETQALPDPEDVLAAPQTLTLPRRGGLGRTAFAADQHPARGYAPEGEPVT